MKNLASVLITLILMSPSAIAQDYSDDRSSPESLIRSLYNAINQHQYARAWSYYGDAPAKDFQTYSKGFENTDHVDVLTGDVSGEGAAGSTFFNVPVAIRAKDAKGNATYFSGCYVLRQVNGAIQEPPYTPLHIQSAKLKSIKKDDFTRNSLPKCGDTPPDDGQAAATVETAKAKFIAEMKGTCDKVQDTQAGLNEPEMHVISYKPQDATPGQPDNKATLFAFSCAMAAYNESNVFYLDAGALGLQLVSFAAPQFTYAYSDQDNAKLKSMTFKGFTANSELTNAEFDATTKSISEFSKWRGLGDASSSGTWVFDDGQFVLKDYAIDPTYDGKQNPMTVVAKGQLVQKP